MDGEIPIEIKSTELLHIEEKRKYYGRFSILPSNHRNLPENGTYVFVVLLRGYPLFIIKLSKQTAEKYIQSKGKRCKISINNILRESYRIADSLTVLSSKIDK